MAAGINDVGIIPSDAKASINYGIEKLRFLEPVLVDSAIQTTFTIKEVKRKSEDQKLLRLQAEMHITGSERPAIVGEVLVLMAR